MGEAQVAQPPGADQGKPSGVQRLVDILLGDLDAGTALDELPQIEQPLAGRRWRGFAQHHDVAAGEFCNDPGRCRLRHRDDDECRLRGGQQPIDVAESGYAPGGLDGLALFAIPHRHAGDAEAIRQRPRDPQEELGAPPRTHNGEFNRLHL
jgi:hypothetical protein